DSLRKKLIDGEQAARFSKELTVLDRHVPVDIGLDETFLKPPDEIRLSELYGRLEFKGLLKNIVKEKEDEREYPWTECASEKDMTALTARCSKSKNIFFDIMPVPEEEGKALAAILRAGGETVFVSFSEGPFKETFRCGIRTVLEDENIEKTGYDLKGQIVLLEKEGITLRGRIFDIMIADYLLDPSASGYDLPSITSRHLDVSLKEETDPTSLSSRRVRIIEEIRGIVEPLLKEKHLAELFDDVEMPLVRVLAEMEANGVNVDTAHLKKKARDIESMLKEVTDRIYALAGEEFNINSPKQLQVILYEKLSLPAIKKTKTGVSTDESVLSKLASMHELPGALLEYREMNKLKTGYYDSLLRLAEKNNGRIHAFFNQAVTATGRLSSSDPNLQNIPVKTLLGQELRRAFVPESKGRVLITADYSQIELKILAHLSEDEKLIKAFRGGEDIHRATASEIFSQPLSAVTDEMRSAAKTVNFGVIYGISAFGLAKDLGIRVDQAQGFIGSYFARYGGIKAFIDRTVETTRETGYVLTLLNRRRYLPEIKSGNEHIRKFAERAAVNTAIQGSAADLIKLAMIECSRRLKGSGAKMIIQVHDELVFDVPEKSAERVSACVKEIMSGIIPLKVPLTVDVECGKNWFDTEPIG
ncbi:MAG: DNA polymerase I, partial [Candidatus Omnitrophica bacterium]|nr:DNA polymerase I [Candidatus Omnitrophota bacterium]